MLFFLSGAALSPQQVKNLIKLDNSLFLLYLALTFIEERI